LGLRLGVHGLRLRAEEALDDVLGRAGAWLHREHGGDGGHALLVGLLPLAPAHRAKGRLGLHHRDALAVDRPDDDGPGRLGGRDLSLRVELVEVLGRVAHDVLGASLGDGDAGGLLDLSTASSKGPCTAALTRRRWTSYAKDRSGTASVWSSGWMLAACGVP